MRLASPGFLFHTGIMKRLIVLMACLLAIPATQAAEPPKGAVISLSAEAGASIAHDEAVLDYRIEAEGRQARPLVELVNRRASRIEKKLGAEKGLVRQTTDRRLEPVMRYDPKQGRSIRTGWRLVQRERITTRRLQALPAIIDAVESGGGHLDGIRFQVSADLLAETRNRLLAEAVRRFRAKAETLARSLGASSFSIVRLDTESRMPPPVRPMMATTLKTPEAGPPVHAGEERVTVRIHGEIRLPARDYRLR